MAKYLLAVHICGGDPPPSKEEMQRSWTAIQALEAELKADGALLFQGALNPASDASVVRAQHDEVLVTDGPFAETKEQLGGFYVIESPDLETTQSWGAKTSAAIGKPIEVREFREGTTD